MVFLATSSTILTWQIFDVGIIVLSALSGPFSIMLVPIATIIWFVRRKKFLLMLLAFLYIGALVQALAIYNGRHQISLGATPALFTKITGQLFLGALLGQQGLEWLTVHFWGYKLLLMLTAILGITAFLYSFVKAPLELQMFNCFATLVFFASLLSPVESGTIPAWLSLSMTGFGCRYWLIPMLSFIVLLIWLLSKKQPRLLRIAAAFTLSMMVFGIPLDWRHPAFVNLEFKTYANKFTTAPQGAKMMIPINPPGWFMELTKH